MEILILHPGALGDVILSLPALTLLKHHLPQARLTLACNSDFAGFLDRQFADRIMSYSALPIHALYLPDPPPSSDLSFWSRFDRIVSWTGSGSVDFERNLKRCCADAIISPWHPSSGEERHVSRLFADSLRPWIPEFRQVPPAVLSVDPTTDRHAISWLEGKEWNGRDVLIALHPGAGNRLKRWPLANFKSLLERVTKEGGVRCLIVEGPAETGLGRELTRDRSPQSFILAESQPLALLAALLKKCKGFAGSDSGIAHLAGACGVPSVVLFGPTLPEHWAPVGSHVIALRDERDCAACGGYPHSSHSCLENLRPDQVLVNGWQALGIVVVGDSNQEKPTHPLQ